MWTYVAEERTRTAALLESLRVGDWDRPSLCEGWTVRHVAGHLNFIWKLSDEEILALVAEHGGFDRASLFMAQGLATAPTTALIDGLRTHADDQRLPPGALPIQALADILLHTQDIAYSLEMRHDAPAKATMLVLDEMVGPRRTHYNPSGGIEGLRFEATDTDWVWGTGQTVAGQAIMLALVLHGRRAPLETLTGEGVETLRQRFTASPDGSAEIHDRTGPAGDEAEQNPSTR